MLAHGNPPPSIPTKGQTHIGPDSSSHTPLRLVIKSESEGEYDNDSEVNDTDEEEAAALDGALLEEDDDDYRSEDDANTTGTTTPRAEDSYDIQGPRDAPVATTPKRSFPYGYLPFSEVAYPLPSTSFCFPFSIFAGLYLGSKSTRVYLD